MDELDKMLDDLMLDLDLDLPDLDFDFLPELNFDDLPEIDLDLPELHFESDELEDFLFTGQSNFADILE